MASIRIPAFYAKVVKTTPTSLCRSSLREALRLDSAQARELDLHLQTRLAQATVSTAAELTRVVHDSCQKVFPKRAQTPAPRAWQHPNAQLEVRQLWSRYKDLRTFHQYHKALRLRNIIPPRPTSCA